jgi:hypothetical protein
MHSLSTISNTSHSQIPLATPDKIGKPKRRATAYFDPNLFLDDDLDEVDSFCEENECLGPFSDDQLKSSKLRELMFDHSMLKKLDNRKAETRDKRKGIDQHDSSSVYYDARDSKFDSLPSIWLDRMQHSESSTGDDGMYKDSLSSPSTDLDNSYSGHSWKRSGNSSRKVRFLDEEEVDDKVDLNVIMRDNNYEADLLPHASDKEKMMRALDIFHDQPACGPLDTNTGKARKDFCRAVYTDDAIEDEPYGKEYNSDGEEVDDNDNEDEKQIIKNMIYNLGGMAVVAAVGKIVKGIRNSNDEDGFGDGTRQAAEHLSEFYDASEVAANSCRSLGTSAGSINTSTTSLNASTTSLNVSSSSIDISANAMIAKTAGGSTYSAGSAGASASASTSATSTATTAGATSGNASAAYSMASSASASAISSSFGGSATATAASASAASTSATASAASAASMSAASASASASAVTASASAASASAASAASVTAASAASASVASASAATAATAAAATAQ